MPGGPAEGGRVAEAGCGVGSGPRKRIDGAPRFEAMEIAACVTDEHYEAWRGVRMDVVP